VVVSFEHGNEPPGCIKAGTSLTGSAYCEILKKESDPWN
jgi:hypothetical protein